MTRSVLRIEPQCVPSRVSRRAIDSRTISDRLGRRDMMLLATAAIAVLGGGLPARAAGSRYYAPGGLALGGYDPVAYFTQGHASRGTGAHALKWKGSVWLFSSHENLAAFEADPRAYAPQFGGWCSRAMVEQGRRVASDPEIFAVRGGRLYLFTATEALAEWTGDPRPSGRKATLPAQPFASGN